MYISWNTIFKDSLIDRATGFRDSNLWLHWMIQTAREQEEGDCVACIAARPHLYTEPAPVYQEGEWGFNPHSYSFNLY